MSPFKDARISVDIGFRFHTLRFLFSNFNYFMLCEIASIKKNIASFRLSAALAEPRYG